MSKHDEGRRAFLIGAAVGAGAAAGLVPDALAQTQGQHHEQHTVGAAAAVPAHAHTGASHGAFFNAEDAATIAAFTERLMPGAPGKPGATDAGVLNYIDLALAGAYADMQDFYRRGLARSRPTAATTRSRSRARRRASGRRDQRARNRQGDRLWLAARAAFFNTLRTHTIEGMFADPVYGGNKDFAGWRLVGFPARSRSSPRGHAEQGGVHGRRSSASRRGHGQGGEWQPKKPMSSSSAWALPAASSPPNSPRRA